MFKKILTAFTIAALAVAAAPAWAQKDLRWGTSAVGSAGHKALIVLADVLNREMPEYQVSVLPTAGAVVTIKGFATGEFDGIFGADIAFHEFANDINRFKGFKANVQHQPMQSFWAFTIEIGAAVHARDKDKIKSWSDLTGKRVFTGPLPWDVRAHIERAFSALGVKHNYVQVDLKTVGSLLESGGIDALAVYTNAEASTPPWIVEAGLATDWAVLNPSAAEVAKLKGMGFEWAEVKPAAFKRDIHADKAVLSPFFYGFHVGLNVPENDVYKMLTIIEKNAAEMAKADAAYSQIARDMPAMQRRGVQSAADFVPVHPGLAKYMREKGVWDTKWDSKVKMN
jgi:hypothetical protein